MAFGAQDPESARVDRRLAAFLDFSVDARGQRFDFRRILDPRRFLRDAEFDIAAQLDVGTAARHVGRDGHCARDTGLRDDVRFLLVVARVQHLVSHSGLGKLRRQFL